MFDEIFQGRRVLVTGHTGFKGSWLTLWLRRLGARVDGLALAPDTDPAHWNLLRHDDVLDHRVDLRDAGAVRDAVIAANPDIVFHLAAQPLVRRSYRDPVATFATNVMGLTHLFEAIRVTPSVRVVINATTDKVYAEHDRPSGYRESDPLGGHDPYSTSKACAELVTDSYRKSFFNEGPSIATARAGNVIGGGDWAEDRLVPDIVRACLSGEPLRVRNPAAIRPWQHVLEPLSGYLRLASRLWSDSSIGGHAWNFGPGSDADLPVEALIARVHEAWPGFRVESAQGPHPHEASILRLDSSRARDELGWKPVWHAGLAVERTVAWYRAYFENGHVISNEDLDAFEADAKRLGHSWAA